VRLGKLAADLHGLADAIQASGFIELAVTAAHAAGVAQLEAHHNDPFDRLLIAQAKAEPRRPADCRHGAGAVQRSCRLGLTSRSTPPRTAIHHCFSTFGDLTVKPGRSAKSFRFKVRTEYPCSIACAAIHKSL